VTADFNIKRIDPAARRSRGFSALELLVAVIIISIVSTAGVLGYSNYRQRNELESAARKITSTMSAARQYAITTNAPYQVVLNLPSEAFWIDEMDALGTSIRRQQATLPGEMPDFVTIESATVESVAATSGRVEIKFWPDGHSDNATIVLLHDSNLGNTKENVLSIKVYGPTGASRIHLGQRL
jgi:prepilin-type N-terminal cleavage/methylation domain-containing protein